jgi:hypothetical protein
LSRLSCHAISLSKILVDLEPCLLIRLEVSQDVVSNLNGVIVIVGSKVEVAQMKVHVFLEHEVGSFTIDNE